MFHLPFVAAAAAVSVVYMLYRSLESGKATNQAEVAVPQEPTRTSQGAQPVLTKRLPQGSKGKAPVAQFQAIPIGKRAYQGACKGALLAKGAHPWVVVACSLAMALGFALEAWISHGGLAPAVS